DEKASAAGWHGGRDRGRPPGPSARPVRRRPDRSLGVRRGERTGKQGIVNGYPDSTFGGKRALTRYEFAMAIQRMLQEVQRRIDAAKLGGTPPVQPPPATGGITQEQLD